MKRSILRGVSPWLLGSGVMVFATGCGDDATSADGGTDTGTDTGATGSTDTGGGPTTGTGGTDTGGTGSGTDTSGTTTGPGGTTGTDTGTDGPTGTTGGGTGTSNEAPLPKDDVYMTPIEVGLIEAAPGVLANDADPDGDPLTVTYHHVTSLQGGRILVGLGGAVSYEPPTGLWGWDSFGYTADDGVGGTAMATARVWVSPDAVELSAVAGGTGGFALHGPGSSPDYESAAGASVSTAGDVNGDGLADLIIGAYKADPNGTSSGTSYVVFGKTGTTAVELSAVAGGTGGFALYGAAATEHSGISVSTAGDVNGDGLADLIVGASTPGGNDSGTSYVVFGKTGTSAVELSAVAGGTGGFALSGAAEGDQAGWSVSTAGDVNGDGLADLIIGAFGADPNGDGSGTSYVVFGKTGTTAMELSAVAGGTGGFALHGIAENDNSGVSVSTAGDVNGDGLSDVIVGAPGADPNGDSSGTSYVVFGKTGTAAVELSDVADGTGGFALRGAAEDDKSGGSVSTAGDVNGDGLADLIIGADGADPNGSESGTSYVVFGKTGTLAVELSDVVGGTGGFALYGAAENDNSGRSVSTAGDINGDGLADLIVGAEEADPNGDGSGTSYVVFGKTGTSAVELSAVAGGTGGFALYGAAEGDQAGSSVSAAGDVNGDGLADPIVGAPFAGAPYASGASYVIFGGNQTGSLTC